VRRFSRLLLLALVIVVIGFYPLLAPTEHRIDQAHFELIQVGMSRADVEAIFGVPPGLYDWAQPDSHVHLLRVLAAVRLEEATGLGRAAAARIGSLEDTRLRRRLIDEAMAFYSLAEVSWVSRHGAFTVQFDSSDCVVSKSDGGSVRIVPPWQRWWQAISKR
jgi:hypothetical protein